MGRETGRAWKAARAGSPTTTVSAEDLGVAPTEIQAELIRSAMAIAARPHVRRLLHISDLPLPGPFLDPGTRSKLVHVVSDAAQRDALEQRGELSVLVPGYEMGRQDKLKLALIGATARGHVQPGDDIVALVGKQPDAFPDSLFVLELKRDSMEPTVLGELGGGQVAPSVFDAIIELAVELGVEGWEGHALGTMFVLGDVDAVMARSRQLALNPFQGYSDAERNLVDPAVREALRSFATLDGAFVVREDGVVVAAGRYLEIEPRKDVQAPLGLGARHMAAALISAATRAIAIVVSQSTGKVRLYRRGAVVLELTPTYRRT